MQQNAFLMYFAGPKYVRNLHVLAQLCMCVIFSDLKSTTLVYELPIYKCCLIYYVAMCPCRLCLNWWLCSLVLLKDVYAQVLKSTQVLKCAWTTWDMFNTPLLFCLPNIWFLQYCSCVDYPSYWFLNYVIQVIFLWIWTMCQWLKKSLLGHFLLVYCEEWWFWWKPCISNCFVHLQQQMYVKLIYTFPNKWIH